MGQEKTFNVLNLDFGHLTDDELGINTSIRKDMIERPKAHIARLYGRDRIVTRNGNMITRVAR